MAIVTIEHGDMLPQTKSKTIDNISFIITDQSLSVADYNLDLGGLSIFALRDAMNVNFNQFETDLGVAGVASQGTLTVDTQPLADDTMTIGTKVYTFMADGTADEDGEIDVGADLADAKTLIVSAINGSDGNNTAHTLVTAATFATNDCVITAIVPGIAGDAIATTETFNAVTNIFDGVTLGTTTAGVDEIDVSVYANHVGGDSLFTMRDKLNSGFSFVDAI